MELIKQMLRNKYFIIGLFIPLLWQAVYFVIAIPAVKDADTEICNMKITIFNEDQSIGQQIAGQLGNTLPFKTETADDLEEALASLTDGDSNMVIYIGGDFTQKLLQGKAHITYYIDQEAPYMTKQVMENAAAGINGALNETIFANTLAELKQNSAAALGKLGLPANVLAMLSEKLINSFDALEYAPVESDIRKLNDAEGFARVILPLFIVLTYFIGCALMTILHAIAKKNLYAHFSRCRIFLASLATNIIVSMIVPWVVIGILGAFDITLSTGLFNTWLFLSLGFFTLLYMVQMFMDWLGIQGMGAAIIILFPLQFVSCGLIYSPEILPSLYTTASIYLPSTYFGEGMFRIFYGGGSPSPEFAVLSCMALIFVAIAALSLLKTFRKREIINSRNG